MSKRLLPMKGKSMNTTKKSPKRLHSKTKSSDDCYVIKYVAEGPERECFFQCIDRDDPRDSFCDELSEATLFRSQESARRTARALDKDHPAGRNSHAVVRVRLGVIVEVKL